MQKRECFQLTQGSGHWEFQVLEEFRTNLPMGPNSFLENAEVFQYFRLCQIEMYLENLLSFKNHLPAQAS